MSKLARWNAVGALAVAVAAAGWMMWGSPGATPPDVLAAVELPTPVTQAAERQAKQVAAEYIAAESDAGPNPPAIEAPPGFKPSASPPAGQPQPPDGYSFTAFHGEMKKGRVAATSRVGESETSATYDWLAVADVDALSAQSSSRSSTFGWVGLRADADLAQVEDGLADLGGEVLGRNGDLLRSRLPTDAAKLRQIAGLPGVSGIAPTPKDMKAPASLLEHAASRPLEQSPSFVTLMADDPNGVWRQALTELGAVVGHFDSATRVYAANIPHSALPALIDADFVLAVEPVGILKPTHDTAVPAMGADALRVYDASTRMFSGNGGGSVPIGVLDTGLNIEHPDITSNRASICGGNFVPSGFKSARTDDLDLWVDVVGHGTHVTGTIAGNGSIQPQFAGMAPLVQHIRFGKVLGASNPTTAVAIGRGMDFLAEASSCGRNPVAAKPLLVNMSLGQDGLDWEGRSVLERKLDATVWRHRQLYVVAAGNSDSRGRGDIASAKNALTVGAATNEGDIASFSSQGPTLDGRLRPQIVGTGVNLASVAGGGSRKGYALSSGTSMSSPAVAGVAALLMEAVPEFREQPAAVRARLIASAIKPDAFLEDITLFPLHAGDGPGPLQNKYGLGKVSARTSVLSRDAEDGWTTGSVIVEVGDGEYGYHDIEVPAGASRLDIALTWDEPPADTLAQPLLNDLDLWVDRDADCPPTQPAACGNAASLSNRDNVEWLILRDPVPGLYRLKVVPKYARVQTPRAALAWTIIRGPSTPQLSVAVDQQNVAMSTGAPFAVDVTITSDGYVAAGAVLRVDCRSGNDGAGLSSSCRHTELMLPRASTASREDAVDRQLDRQGGDRVALGEVAVGEEQRVRLMFPGSQEPEHLHLYFTASAWNANGASASAEVVIGAPDGSPPAVANAPANDDYANAVPLAEAGETTFDLLLATPEPGEPPFERGFLSEGFFGLSAKQDVRPRSIWYAWRAPRAGAYRFDIAASALDDYADVVQMDLFEVRDEPLVSLASINGRAGGGLTFEARAHQAYRIRLSVTAPSLRPEASPFGPPVADDARRVMLPLALAWGRAERPANDDLRFAASLEGETGELEGSNLGATPEGGEPLGELAATVWYQWTAPATGDWEFAVDRRDLRLAVFTGDQVGSLRLVSGSPEQSMAFAAQEGATYHIAVAAKDASTSGSDFALTWGPGTRFSAVNDDVANAEPLSSLAQIHVVSVDFDATTVEPGEPAASGTRTAWWSWTAPEDGDYMWRVDTLSITLRLSVFAGEDVSNLTLLASSDDAAADATVSFTATAGERYLLAAGLPPDSAFAELATKNLTFVWGQLPANDDFANAAALDGMSGIVFGSTQFATVEVGERTGRLGDASTWWIWEAPNVGWYRFTLQDPTTSGTVAIFKVRDDGDLEHVVDGRRVATTLDASLRTEAGGRYAVRVGSIDQRGQFALRWELDGPPTWLRYLGQVRNGDLDANREVIRMSGVDSLAFDAEGGQLFAASLHGLQRYERDAATGALRVGQTLGGIDQGVALHWDGGTKTLLAGSCDGWTAFATNEDGTLPEEGMPIGGLAPCRGDAMLWDSTSTFLYAVTAGMGIDIYALDAERSAFSQVSAEALGVQAATLSPEDDVLYAATVQSTVAIYARDEATGELTLTATLPQEPDQEGAGTDEPEEGVGVDQSVDGAGVDEAREIQRALSDVRLLAVDASNRYLLAFGRSGLAPAAFDLENMANPLLGRLSAFTNGWSTTLFAGLVPGCRFVSMRTQTLSADVVCIDAVYSVRLKPSVPLLRAEDDVYSRGVDRFGNHLPSYSMLEGGVAASPDGRHIYVSDDDSLLVFERVGAR